ncbi:hypothetical protein ACLB2K_051005 [Fragaria x ananassa]
MRFKMEAETFTLLLVNLAGIMERADESLLPGVYKEVGAALHTDRTGLGSLTLFRSMVQSLCYPIAANLAVRHNRVHIIALGAFLWAAATFLVAFSSTFYQVAISRALNGIGLALVAPSMQSLVAESTDDSSRAPYTIMGIPGWRVSFHLVGLISVIVGILVRIYATDPHFPEGTTKESNQSPSRSFLSEVKELAKEAKSVIKIPSFQIVVAQGVTGSFPWSSLSFAPMWLEFIGFSHGKSAFLIALFAIGSSLGGLFGGKMGDILSVRFPNAGRIILAQISSASAIPLAAILLLVLPDDPSTAVIHGLVLFIMGFLISWNAPATNNPIFAEIVPESWDFAQHVYGYKPVAAGSSASEEITTDRGNALSLAKALYTAIGIPMALCCVIYSFLYCTYPRDRERARMEVLIESEMQHIDNSPSGDENSQMRFPESEELFVNDRTVIDVDYEGEKGLVGDAEDDEQALLYRQLTFANMSRE